MEPRKLSVAFVSFPYGGVGNSAQTHPECEQWIAKAVIAAKADPRVSEVFRRDFNDTPITMTRNAAVDFCQNAGIDVLIMVDSDQCPDLYLGTDPTAKPFFQSSFDFLYAHWEKGPVAIVAPYCGPPAHPVWGGGELPYVFRWCNQNNGEPTPGFRQERYSREEAANRTGFEEVSSGPTGCCMIDMRCFDMLQHPYFYYEYKDDGVACPTCHQPKPGKRAEKSGTEDCAFFRDLSLNCIELKGYNCVFCNWDAWAGHWKPKCVGKPETIKSDQIAETLRNVVLRKEITGMKRMVVKRGNLPVHEADARGVKLCVNPVRTTVLNGNGKGVFIPNPSNCETNGAAKIEVVQQPAWVNPQDRISVSSTDPCFVHPDDPRLAEQAVEIATNGHPEAFKECHNTHPRDMEILTTCARTRAFDAARDERTLRIVELGSWVGHSAVAMAKSVSEVKDDDWQIHCVDNFKGGNALQRKVAKEHRVREEFEKNTAPYKGNIILHENSTHDCALSWRLNDQSVLELDMVFVDADHSYEGCKQDILDWWPFLRTGGVMIGHDFSCNFPGVRQAVIECFGFGVATEGDMWIAKKGLDPMLLEKHGIHETLVEFGAQPA